MTRKYHKINVFILDIYFFMCYTLRSIYDHDYIIIMG